MDSISGNSAYFDSLGLRSEPTKEEPASESDEFMTLMLAQIQNQDPMDPMDNGEFLTQLAQINSAGSLAELQSSSNDINEMLQSSQALQASSMVGRTVAVPSDMSALRGGKLAGSVGVPEVSDRVDVKIYDQGGALVKTLDLGALEGGIADFSWDGKDSDGNTLPDGQYEMKATAWYGSSSEALPTMANALVESVTIGRGGEGLALNLDGLGSWKMADVFQIHQ